MPKINIYVPDELAEAVKEAGIPVSAVCQRALEIAVKRVTAIREAVQSPPGDIHERSGRMARFTERASTTLKLAVRQARAESAPEVGTDHLLLGLLDEGTNLALHVLRALEIEPEQVRRELDRHRSGSPQPPSDTAPSDTSAESTNPPSATPPNAPSDTTPSDDALPPATATDFTLDPESAVRIGNQAAAALELAVTEAVGFGHNYVGGEHLLLGLIAEPDGIAGRVLRGLGAELRLTRRAVSAALAGYVHLRANQQQAAAAAPTLADPMAKLSSLIEQQLKPVVQRIETLESRLPK